MGAAVCLAMRDAVETAVRSMAEERPSGELPRPEGRGFLLHGQHLHHRDV